MIVVVLMVYFHCCFHRIDHQLVLRFDITFVGRFLIGLDVIGILVNPLSVEQFPHRKSIGIVRRSWYLAAVIHFFNSVENIVNPTFVTHRYIKTTPISFSQFIVIWVKIETGLQFINKIWIKGAKIEIWKLSTKN